jgi:type VI secretion system VgrG family protein
LEISNQSLKFHSDALAENTLLLTKLRGEEQLSGLFRFELELISTDPKVDLDAALYKPAKVAILQRLGDQKAFRWFQGALAELEEHEQGQGWVSYRAVLVPDLWRLRECHRSRIFQGKTIDELVGDVLKKSLSLQGGQDFDFKLARTKAGDRAKRPVYPEREYVVQYEETDLDFVSRWLEHEGIFYFFENDGTREKVVFADSTGAYKPVSAQGSTYLYRPQGRSRSTASERDGGGDAEEIHTFRCRATRQPRKVRLNDYNWRDPAASLVTQKDVHASGTGLQLEYNDHYKTPEQGKELAEVRAQEWSCRGASYTGEGTCRAFRPGRKFELDEHFRSDWNREYLLTRVVHEASQSINLEASNVTAADYKNAFEAIPADLTFRPLRTTAWPSIKGVIHARIDAEGEGDYAELDEHGRYKVRLPFDEHEADAAPGKASRWVRMAQPYAGVDSGMHFPLLKGTEVILTHVDGDPDRPIIAAAVPNPETASPVHDRNRRQNRLRTTNGNVLVFDDNAAMSGFVFMDASRARMQDFRQPGGRRGAGAGGGGGGEPTPAAAPTPAPAAVPVTPAQAAAEPSREAGRSWLLDQLLRHGNPSPSAPTPGPSGGRGAEGDEDDYSTLQEFIEENPSAAFLINTASTTLQAQGADFRPGYLLDAAKFERLVSISHGSTVGFTYAPTTYEFSMLPLTVGVTFGSKTTHETFMGDQHNVSNFLGIQDNAETFVGNKNSASLMLAAQNEASVTLGSKVVMTCEVSGISETAICLSAKSVLTFTAAAESAVNFTAAAKAVVNFTAAAEVEVNLVLAAKMNLTVVLSGELNITLGLAAKLELNIVPSKFQVTIPDETEVRLTKLETQLTWTKSSLANTQMNLATTKTELADTSTQLQQTKTQLSKTDTQLNKTGMLLMKSTTALNDAVVALNEDATALNNKITALNDTNTAGLHSIT